MIKLIIIAGAYYIISDKLLHYENFSQVLWTERISVLGVWGLVFFVGILFLSLLNWIFEIFKWRSLVESIYPMSFHASAKQSLASLTASLITPNRIGEYGAKAAYFEKNNRSKVMLLNFVSNSYQMLITVLMGTIGLFFLRSFIFEIHVRTSVYYGIILLLLSLGAGIIFIYKKWTDSIDKLLRELQSIPQKIHKKTFVFSLARYAIFSHQFYFFLLFFGVDIDYFIGLPIIYAMYLISSVIPGFVLFDWLVKGSVAVTLFQFHGVDEIVILSVTASMWILNFAIPAILGSVYVISFNAKKLKFNELRS